jgi:hypothetical protein
VNIYYRYISLSSHNEIHTHFSPKYDFIVTFSDNLRSVSVKGRDAQDVLDIAQRSYLDRNYKPGWDIESVQLVENKILEESYR